MHSPSYGIVGQIADDGTLDTNDDGQPLRFIEKTDTYVLVRVVLQPTFDEVLARYGTSFAVNEKTEKGQGAILSPIRGGDEVVVDIPGGDPNIGPVIKYHMNNKGAPLPVAFDNVSHLIGLGDYPVKIINHQGFFCVIGDDGALTYKAPSGFFMQFDSDGYFKVRDADNNWIWSDSSGIQITTANGGGFKIGDKGQIITNGTIDMQASQVNTSCGMAVGGSLQVGGVGVPVALLTDVVTALTSLQTQLNAAPPSPITGPQIGLILGAIISTLSAAGSKQLTTL